jgi:hypothetical protein
MVHPCVAAGGVSLHTQTLIVNLLNKVTFGRHVVVFLLLGLVWFGSNTIKTFYKCEMSGLCCGVVEAFAFVSCCYTL